MMQRAYRVLAAGSREALERGAGDMWDSGKVESGETIGVEYGGKPAGTSQRVWWKVKTWDNRGEESGWSEPGVWVAGVMKAGDWKAKWIGPAERTRRDADMGGARWVTGKAGKDGKTTLRKKFNFGGAGDGGHAEFLLASTAKMEVKLNGKQFHRYTGHVFDWRYLRFRDATPWLKAGENELEVAVEKPEGGLPAAFIAAMRVGGKVALATDGTWGEDLGGARETEFGKQLIMREETASPAFAKTFGVRGKVKEATLHVTGVGFYEASLNGMRVGEKVLDPSPTDYSKRVLYSTYDVTGMLKEGENRMRVLVGHGWYDVRSSATWNFDNAPWRDYPRMIAQLDVVYADGRKETVASDGTWRQVSSEVGYDCIREGEVIGARHYAGPDLDKEAVMAEEVPGPAGALQAETCEGAKVMRTLAPKAIHDLGGGSWMVEFAEDMAGWIRMKVRGQRKGDVMTVRYDERVDAGYRPAAETVGNGLHEEVRKQIGKDSGLGPKGEAVRMIDCHFHYTASHNVCARDAAFQTDRFVSGGGECEIYEPRFTYNGYRYVLLKGLRQAPRKEDIEARIVHTAFKTVGEFESSDATLNALMAMADRAYRGNFTDGVPTDCPHREKNGWTGDASVASELAQYCYENTAGYEKWLQDLIDTQLDNGDVCCIVPTSGWGFKWGNGPAWDSALPVVAWNLWCYRGDRRAVDLAYGPLTRYVEYTLTRAEGFLVKHGLGDWIPVDWGHNPPVEFTSSCYFRQAAELLSRMAKLKGDGAAAEKYGRLAEEIRKAINAKYYKGDGTYCNGRQTAQAFPLAFGVAEEGERAKVEAKLAAAVELAGGHVDFGLLGSKHVFRALSRAGKTGLALKMLTNPGKPSMVEWIQKGGTTLWEDWGHGSSRNHIMFGDFVAWAYQHVAGIRLEEGEGSSAAMVEPAGPGMKRLALAPVAVEGLDWARARVDGPNGVVESGWRREGGRVKARVVVPPNTRAVVELGGGERREVGSGEWEFEVTSR